MSETLKLITKLSELKELEEKAKYAKFIAVDSETTGLKRFSVAIGVSLSFSANDGYYIPVQVWKDNALVNPWSESAYIEVQKTLETILLHVMRSHFRLSIEQLVLHLSELEQMVNNKTESATALDDFENSKEIDSIPPMAPPLAPQLLDTKSSDSSTPTPLPSPPNPSPSEIQSSIKTTLNSQPVASAKPSSANSSTLFESFTTEDPTPTLADLGKTQKTTKPPSTAHSSSAAIPAKKREPAKQQTSASAEIAAPSEVKPLPKPSPQEVEQRPMHVYDTLMHFAAVELDGKLQKN